LESAEKRRAAGDVEVKGHASVRRLAQEVDDEARLAGMTEGNEHLDVRRTSGFIQSSARLCCGARAVNRDSRLEPEKRRRFSGFSQLRASLAQASRVKNPLTISRNRPEPCKYLPACIATRRRREARSTTASR